MGPTPDDPNAMLSQVFGQVPGVPLEVLLQQAAKDEKADIISRDPPEPSESRKALVNAWTDAIKQAKKHWQPAFDRMREDQRFAYGKQWSKSDNDKRYVANLTLRTIQQRVAFLYSRNPKAVARRREMIMNTVWDGTQEELQSLQQSAQEMMQGAQQGMPPGPDMMPLVQHIQAVAQDAAKVSEGDKLLDRVARTLELLYEYNISQQVHPFKQLMKMTVRRACTTGVAYVKLGFERVMVKRPDVVAKLSDLNERLGTLERLAADIADGESDENSAEAEELKLMMLQLQKEQTFIAHEGLVYDYPSSFAIIPDTKCLHLRGFLGSDWVAEEYILSPNEVKEIYNIDVGKQYNSYRRPDAGVDIVQRANGLINLGDNTTTKGKGNDKQCCCVWEAYNRKDGLVYVLCDGYKDFLKEPAGPDTPLERFWPWFTLTLNDCDNEDDIFPPSDVRLIRDMQLDYNRARQGLREHRRAARPKTVVSSGALDDEDLGKLESHPDNAILELNGLQPGQKVEDLLQPFTGPKIEPALYDVTPYFDDTMRTVGMQEANMGPTNSDTATQSQISEASRTTMEGSNVDDIDDLLTHMAKYGGQLLLSNVGAETVKRVVGPGAVWPELTRQQIAEEIWLEIEAGSAGRPNQAQEVANAQKVYPLLMQIPGISPEFLARDLIKRLDDKIDLTQAFKPMLPSIVAMNTAAKTSIAGAPPPAGTAPGGPTPPGVPPPPPGNMGPAPAMQGPNGAGNAPTNPRPGGSFPPPIPPTASGPDVPAPGLHRLTGPTH